MNLKRTKGTNTNIDDDKSKHEDYKKILLNGASMRHEMNRINSFSLYLKMNLVGYHIFINQLVNHIKN